MHSWLLAGLLACQPGGERPVFATLPEALASLTAADSTWHLGTRADCTSPFLDEMIAEDSGYQPYQRFADLNQDGQVDVAVAVIKGDSGKIYWIPGRSTGYGAPVLLGDANWIKEGGLVTRDSTLLFGRFYSDDSVVWIWNTASQRLEVFVPDPLDR